MDTWSQNQKRAFSRTQTIRTHASKLCNQSAYQEFENSVQFLVEPGNLEKMTERINLHFICIRQLSFCPLRVHHGHFVVVNKPKLYPNKEMDGGVKLDWNFRFLYQKKQNKPQFFGMEWEQKKKENGNACGTTTGCILSSIRFLLIGTVQ